MLKDMKIKDLLISISDYPSINSEASVRDAFFYLRKNFLEGLGFRSIFVIDKDDNIKGHLTMMDLIKAVEPRFLKEIPVYQGLDLDEPELSIIWQQSFSEQCKEEARKSVTDVMKSFDTVLSIEDPIAKAAYLMVKLNIRVLPVKENNKIVGVIRMVDIFKDIAKLILDD